MITINSTKWPLLCLSSLFLIACDPEFSESVNDTSNYSNGDADFSNYVSIGDSLTAGYSDAALYRSGQISSFPNILATQFKTVGGGAFTQPLMEDNLGGLLNQGSLDFNGDTDIDGDDFLNRLVLDMEPTFRTPPENAKPVPIEGTPINEVIIGAPVLSGTFNNMGVPGAKSFHLVTPNYGDSDGLLTDPVSANPYFVRFASISATTILSDAAQQQPTFFTLWMGNNDILSYAADGGAGTDQTGNSPSNPLIVATYGSEDITDPTVFAFYFNTVLTNLTLNPATKGVLVNIPDVSTIPFFTTVKYNAIPLDSVTVENLQLGFVNAYNLGLDTVFTSGSFPSLTQDEVNLRKISFSAGLSNAPIIDASEEVTDGTLTDLSAAGIPAIRQANSSDLIVLTAATIIGTANTGPTDVWGLSPFSPLPDSLVLTPTEINAINTARLAFNATIKAAADANDNLAFYDASAFMTELQANGIDYGTGNITATYGTGGGFSLDGVHPTARGYSLIANGLIDTINTAFNASIPRVDPGTYTTIFLK